MRRALLSAVTIAALLTTLPPPVRADVTIRYAYEMSSPITPAANKSSPIVIYMKGTKGVTVTDSQITIADFSRQQITIIDPTRKKYTTIAAADYAGKIVAQVGAVMADANARPGVADTLKTMKTPAISAIPTRRKPFRVCRRSSR